MSHRPSGASVDRPEKPPGLGQAVSVSNVGDNQPSPLHNQRILTTHADGEGMIDFERRMRGREEPESSPQASLRKLDDLLVCVRASLPVPQSRRDQPPTGACHPTRLSLGLPTESPQHTTGEVTEWPNVPVSKTGVPETVPWVRIPPSPLVFRNRPSTSTSKGFLIVKQGITAIDFRRTNPIGGR